MANSCTRCKESIMPTEYHRVNTSEKALHRLYNGPWHWNLKSYKRQRVWFRAFRSSYHHNYILAFSSA